MMKKLITLIPFILWLGGFCLFAYKINHLSTDTSKNTDAIIVLTGGRNRIHEASKLFNENKAKHLFISGVAKDITLDDIQNKQNNHQQSNSNDTKSFTSYEMGYIHLNLHKSICKDNQIIEKKHRL